MAALPLPIILIVCHLLSSCGLNKPDPNFQSYVWAFEEAADEAGYPQIVRAKFKFVRNGTTAWIMDCVEEDGDIQVEVDRKRWDLLTEGQKEFAVFHMLGHCQLDQDHRENLLSFMNEFVPGPNFYEVWRKKMVRELFKYPFGR